MGWIAPEMSTGFNFHLKVYRIPFSIQVTETCRVIGAIRAHVFEQALHIRSDSHF